MSSTGSEDPNGLSGKVAVVTGAASGIGAATAAVLAERGVSVVVADVDADGARAVADEINQSGGSALAVLADVAEEADVIRMLGAASERFGGVDVLHNNAAATNESVQDDDLLHLEVEVWDRTMAVNVRGAMLGCKHVIPYMLERGGGVIVNTSSGAGTLAEPVRTAYGASKAALNSLTRSVAVQYGKANIRCVAIAPGIIMAPEIQEHIGGSEWLQMMTRHHLTPYLGTPREIGMLVAYLVSEEARFITGCVVPIDGGITAPVPYAVDARGRGTGIF